MRHITSKRLNGTLCTIGFAIAAFAHSTFAGITVGDTPLAGPSTLYPFVFEMWGIDYRGSNTGNWIDETGLTNFERDFNLNHSYNPNDQMLYLGDAEDRGSNNLVLVELIFDFVGDYPAPHGQQMDPAFWASMTVESDYPITHLIRDEGASWMITAPGQLTVWQSWRIFPQPSAEWIDLGNIIENAGGQSALTGLYAETSRLLPEPAALSLLALAGLITTRRRRF